MDVLSREYKRISGPTTTRMASTKNGNKKITSTD